MKKVFFIVMAAVLLTVTACSYAPQNAEEPQTSPTEEAAPTPEPTSEPTPEPTPEPDNLPQIDCSTARKPIVAALFELFKSRGYTGPEPMCSKTHGAWLNLGDKKADILFLIAPTQEEKEYLHERNVDAEMKVYGYDGLVFIGNEDNPVKDLTSDQIRAIYRGEITNWKEVGGENKRIAVYYRDDQSGSQRLFESLVWDGYVLPYFDSMGFSEGDVDPDADRHIEYYGEEDDMGEMSERVIVDKYAIGFNISSYIDEKFSNSGLKLFSVDGVYPDTQSFESGAYPYLTTSYVVIRADEAEDSPARKLYDWVGSDESRSIIAENSTLTVAFSDSVFVRSADYAPEPATTPLSDFILELDKRNITENELAQYTDDELDYIRNGIYALSGAKFKTQRYSNYFKNQPWYQEAGLSDSEVRKSFNEFQEANLSVVLKYCGME